jgi:hypothetical protein
MITRPSSLLAMLTADLTWNPASLLLSFFGWLSRRATGRRRCWRSGPSTAGRPSRGVLIDERDNDPKVLLKRRPDLGTLVGEDDALRAQLTGERGSSVRGASALTAAELRLLPLLSTHLSGPEIADH